MDFCANKECLSRKKITLMIYKIGQKKKMTEFKIKGMLDTMIIIHETHN